MMVIYVSVKFEFDWTNRFRVESPETKNVDGQTDVGHINVIDGLVTRNPPKNGQKVTLKLKVKVTKQQCSWHCPYIYPHTKSEKSN